MLASQLIMFAGVHQWTKSLFEGNPYYSFTSRCTKVGISNCLSRIEFMSKSYGCRKSFLGRNIKKMLKDWKRMNDEAECLLKELNILLGRRNSIAIHCDQNDRNCTPEYRM